MAKISPMSRELDHGGGVAVTSPRFLLILLTLMSAVTFMDRQIMAVLIQPVKAELGLSDLQIGLVTGLGFAGCFALLGLPLGRLADRGPRRRLIALSRGVGGAMAAAGAAATGFWGLLASRAGSALGDAGGGPASMALLAERFPARQRSRVLSVFGTGGSLGALLAMLIGGWMAQRWGWRWTLAVVGGSSVLLALLLHVAVAESQPGRPAGEPAARGVVRELLREPLTRWLLLGASCAFLAGYGFGSWNTALLVRRHGLDLQQAGLVSAGAAALSVLGGLASGALADRWSRRDARWQLGVPVLGLTLAMPCAVAYLLLPAGRVFGAALLIGAFAFFVVWWAAPVLAGLSLVVGPARRATASALVLMAGALVGNGLAPIATGWLSDVLDRHASVPGQGEGLAGALLVTVAMLVPAGLAFAAAMRRYPSGMAAARRMDDPSQEEKRA